jgi:hypothetical protein
MSSELEARGYLALFLLLENEDACYILNAILSCHLRKGAQGISPYSGNKSRLLTTPKGAGS